MTQPRDPDSIIATWLDDGPIDLPADTRRAIAVGLRTQPRVRRMAFLRAALPGPRRFRSMPILSRIAFAATALLAFVVVGVLVFPRSTTNIASTPVPTTTLPSSSPVATTLPSSSSDSPRASEAASVLDTSAWTPYTSNQYGFAIAHPPGWVSYPASRAWALDGTALDPLSAGMDSFMPLDDSVRVSAWITPVDGGTSLDEPAQLEQWVANYCEKTKSQPCQGIHDRAIPLCNEPRDCHPALLIPFKDDVEAFAANGNFNGVLVMAVWRTDGQPSVAPFGGATRLLEAFLSTANVVPTPVLPQSLSPMGLTTFTSPRNGYTVDVSFSWARTPATQAWPGDDGIEAEDPPFSDVFHDADSGSRGATIKALPLPEGTTDEVWLAQWQRTRVVGGHCLGSATPWTDATVAGRPAKSMKWRCDGGPNGTSDYDEYTFLADGKGFVISGRPALVDILVRSFRMP